jgi:hypothetical protein
MRHLAIALLLLAVLLPTLPAEAEDNSEKGMFECPGLNGEPLFTNKDVAGCQRMTLKPLTVAPTLPDRPALRANSYDSLVSQSHRSFPEDWMDHGAPVGSLRNSYLRSGLYGTQGWFDLNAPSGSFRNDPLMWPWTGGYIRFDRR